MARKEEGEDNEAGKHGQHAFYSLKM